jgi:protoheme IX farnesyltransferase
MPVLIAWAAVTGSLSWTPVVLFLIIFFWTPPHYWPLAMRFKDDYAAAGVPMAISLAKRAATMGATKSAALAKTVAVKRVRVMGSPAGLILAMADIFSPTRPCACP